LFHNGAFSRHFSPNDYILPDDFDLPYNKAMKAAEYLEGVKKRPQMFVHPLNVENLRSYLNGFNNGYLLSKDNLQFADKIAVWKYFVKLRGWQVGSCNIEREMQEVGRIEEEILNEMLQVEIEVWKHLELEKSK
jgi:hypothetical protein